MLMKIKDMLVKSFRDSVKIPMRGNGWQLLELDRRLWNHNDRENVSSPSTQQVHPVKRLCVDHIRTLCLTASQMNIKSDIQYHAVNNLE